MRSIHFDPDAWQDFFFFWLASDRKTARRITRLIAEIQRDPFDGIGKPEPLKGELAGYWSRRSDDEHLRQSVPHVAQFGGRELDVRRVAG